MASDRKRNQRLETLGGMAAALAHEVRNPLSTMSVNLQLLAEDFAQPATPVEQRTLRRARLLLGEVKRLDGLVADFLKLVRGYEIVPETVDLELLVADLLRFCDPENARLSVRARFLPDPAARFALADPGLLRTALLNLVLNAQQAMAAGGGELLLETRAREREVEVSITDTGPGIPPELQERVFRPWFSTKEGGTGLGLPTARRIVEELGGELLLHSEVGRGTRFTVRVPRPPPALPPGGEAPA
ncbi:MAG: two-component sensor histidine kinase [Planctomycetes bacterium]|nr:two-component sensor histidine kinase [Planctomycetota bacterium]